jgi:hypothetical protein
MANIHRDILLLAFGTYGITGAAQAQTLPDAGALRQQIEQGRETAPPQFPQPAKPLAPPPLSSLKGVVVNVTAFEFSGNTLIASEALQSAVADFLHRPLDYAQLQAAAAAVADLYRRAGWIVRAYFPEQDIANGAVTIQIVEAVYGGAKVEGAGPQRVSLAHIQSILDAHQKVGEVLNADALDRALFVAGELPGVGINGTLAEGTHPGETDLVLRFTDELPIRGNVIGDNGGSRSTGPSRVSAEIYLNSILGLGDQFSGNIIASEGSNYLRVGATLPVGNDGWRVGTNASAFTYRLIAPEFTALDATGSSNSGGLEANYPLVRSRLRNLYFNANADRKTYDTYAVTQAKYLASDNSTIVDLTGNVSVTGNLVTLVDGTGGSAQFTVAPSATVTSSSGQLAAGNYQLGAAGAGGNSSNFSNTITVVGAYTVGRKGVTANGNGISKTYDGTTGMQGINLALNGKLSGDFLDVNGSGAFSQSNTGANLGYAVSAMSLGGADANDYFLASGSSFTGSNGVILPKAVTLTAPIAVKGYDGALTYLISASELAALSSQLGVDGSSVSAAAVNYVDKNAGQGNKVVTLDAVTINDGNSGGNFNVTRAGNNASTINQAALVIVASNGSKLQDGAPFIGGAGIQPSGFVAGEGLSSLAGLLAYSGDSQGAVSAGTYSIVPQGLTSNNYAIQFVPGTLVINGSTPVVVVPRGTNGGGSGGDTGSGTGGSGGLTEPGSGGTTGSGTGPATEVTNALRMSIIKVATTSETGLLRVFVPSATKATSAGFTFKLPDQIIDGIPENASITATMTDGSALAPWLKFDLSTRTFTATSLPPGALPMRVIVNISGRTYVVEIVESSN